MKNFVYNNVVTKHYKILYTELNARNVEYNSDIKVMGIKKLKDLLKQNENENKKECEIDNKTFNPKIDHNIWMNALI